MRCSALPSGQYALSVARRFLAVCAVFGCLAGGEARAREGTVVTISSEDCARLVVHRPDPDVAFRPGVDVDGNPVAPADIGASVIPPPVDEVSIVVEIELGGRLGMPPARSATAKVGTVVVKDGRAYFNDQALTGDAMQALSEACQRYGRH